MVDFKPIPGYEGRYKINKSGIIIGPYQKPLKTSLNSNGYPAVYLYIEGKRRKCTVHSLVMLTWAGPRPEDLIIRHLDGNPLNYAFDNLTYGTFKENEDDKITHGTQLTGEKCLNAVLTERKVKIARGLYKCGFTFSRISEILQVKYHTIWAVVRNRNWVGA